MKLYNFFRSSASFRVRIALALKGLPYDYRSVHLARGDHKQPALADLTAEGLVPLLELDDGTRLTQSLGRARVRALAQIVACEIHPLNNLRALKYLTRELKVSEDDKNTWYRHWVREGLESFEKQLAAGPQGRFCHGDTPTLADLCLVPQIFNGKRFDVNFDGLTHTMRVFDQCMKVPAFQQAQPSACPDAEA